MVVQADWLLKAVLQKAENELLPSSPLPLFRITQRFGAMTASERAIAAIAGQPTAVIRAFLQQSGGAGLEGQLCFIDAMQSQPLQKVLDKISIL